MGQELECRMRLGKRSLAGKAYLETDFVLFRGDERLKVAFKDLTSVTAKAGVLRLDFDGGPAELELGKAAEKWADKILHPPTRADKLGVKEGSAVRLVGEFDPEFLDELRTRGASMVEKGGDVVFYRADKAADLKRVAGLQPSGSAALWVIYPKGVPAIREIDVLQAGRAAGLKDVKVASFSATHTGLKFVLPLAKR
jgi:hypothetical protein